MDIRKPRLKCFVDAAHINDLRNRRSTTGYVFTFAGGALVYKSKKHALTAGSSTEAESIAAVSAAKTARYLRSVLREMGFEQRGPTIIYINNMSALKIINDNTLLLSVHVTCIFVSSKFKSGDLLEMSL